MDTYIHIYILAFAVEYVVCHESLAQEWRKDGALNRERICPQGLPIYTFRYIAEVAGAAATGAAAAGSGGAGRWRGTMAQDLLALGRADAVVTTGGYYMVDYSRLDVEFEALQ